MKRTLFTATAILATLALLLYAASFWAYSRTDTAFEELVSARPSTRAEVESVLHAWPASTITRAQDMNHMLAKALTPQQSYVRYSRYFNDGIDVVYDKAGHVLAIWPNYE